MTCPFMSKQMNGNLYPCIDGCALKVQGKCAIAILAQAKLAENKNSCKETSSNYSPNP